MKAPCRSLLLVLSFRHSQVVIGEKTMWIVILVSMAPVNGPTVQGKRLTSIYKMEGSCYLIFEPSYACHLLVDTSTLTSPDSPPTWKNLFGRIYSLTTSFHMSFLTCPSHAPPQPLTIQLKHWLWSLNQYVITQLAVFPPHKMHNRVCFPKFFLLGRLAFTAVLQGCPRKGPQYYSGAIHYVPLYHVEASTKQVLAFSSSVNQS